MLLIFSFRITFGQRNYTNSSPSVSEYFSWINHTNEGPSAEQTLANLSFFEWMNKKYGVQLDIYALDAGAIDGFRFYGSDTSARFKKQFPNGFDPLVKKAQSINTRLGLWAGPDGFGNSLTTADQRLQMMVGLVREKHFGLFKFDAVCGPLAAEHGNLFIRMMEQCYASNPDLVVLNHRLDLGEKGQQYATTYLLGGEESYIDVHQVNQTTGGHHRVKAISRAYDPELKRLAEDHGVCFGSGTDYWEDDFVLHAFGRNLIVSPQIYGNPWLLKDEEFGQLARLWNLHRQHKALLVNGQWVGKKDDDIVSRGDEHRRFIILRNLSWQPKKQRLKLDKSLGLGTAKHWRVKLHHPWEQWLGDFNLKDEIEIEVLPFRVALVEIGTPESVDVLVKETPYLSEPTTDSTSLTVKLLTNSFREHVEIEGNQKEVLSNEGGNYQQSGRVNIDVDPFAVIETPKEIYSIYEAAQHAVGNSALEVDAFYRAGETKFEAVTNARNAFFEQEAFVEREAWDHYLFDGNLATHFSVPLRHLPYNPYQHALRIQAPSAMKLDSLVLTVPDAFALQPYPMGEAFTVKATLDFAEWKDFSVLAGKRMVVKLDHKEAVRYFTFPYAFIRLSEVQAFYNGKALPMDRWRASNLQAPYVFDWHWNKEEHHYAQKVWKKELTVGKLSPNSYLCVALEGKHGVEGAVCALRVDGRWVGPKDRAPSYPVVPWEYRVKPMDANYTFFFPMPAEYQAKTIEVFVLGMDAQHLDFTPTIHLLQYPHPYFSQQVKLRKIKL
ncbi:hypothetical protein PEDI_50160 [Persicobacter diffluens]|uniref:Uncharacterized protein n=1 Tax=Persicobacter diffluens TaxID=981 RepID=A0AAN5AMH8_9BACT|nr:hypothetical protein PEDI_50160 [Persicobacter diffluens]